MGFGKCHLFFRCARMKFFPLLLYLLLLLNSFQGSILSHKRSIRALNTTLHTDFNGTYERRNPCTNAKIETTSYIASHEFRHHTKEDKWSDYTNKCTAIISSFLRALGNLVRFSNNQNAVFNFHINTSISQKQDGTEPGIGNSSCSLPTITIEATDCEIFPKSSCQNAPIELKESKGKIPDERKYTFSGHSSNAKSKTINQASKGVPATDQLQYQSGCQISNEPPKTYVSIKPQENHVATGHSQIRSIIKLEPPSKSVNKNLVNQRFVAEDELQTEENWTLTDATVTPQFSGGSTVAKAEDYFQTDLSDYPQYIKFTLEPEQDINLIETSTEPEYSYDPSSRNLKAATLRPENEFMTASIDEIDQTQNEPLLPNIFNSPPPNSSKSPLTYLQKSDTTASLDTTESDQYGALTTRNHQYYSPQTPMLRTESTSQRTQSMNDDDILIRNQDESYGNGKELSFVHSKQPLTDYMNKQVPDSQFNEPLLNQQPVNSFFSSDQILGPQLPFLPSVRTTDKTSDNKNFSTVSPKSSFSLSNEEIIANPFLEGVQPAESLSYRVPYSKSNSLKRPPAETYFLKNPARNANPLLQNQKYNTTSFETFTADQQPKHEEESRNSYIDSPESQTQILSVTTNLKTEPDKFFHYPNQLETYTAEPSETFTSDPKKPLEVENSFLHERRSFDKKSNIPMSKFPTSNTPLIPTQILDFPRDTFFKYDNEEIMTSTTPGVDDSGELSETELSLNNNFAGITSEPQISKNSGFSSSPETEIPFSNTISTPRVRDEDEINEPLTELLKEETDDDVNYVGFLSTTLPKSQKDNFHTSNKLPLSVSEPHSYYSEGNFEEDFSSQNENLDEELRVVSQPSFSSFSSDFNEITKAPRNNDQVLTKYPTTMTPEIQSDQLSVSSDLNFPEPELFSEKSESRPVRNFETTEEAFSSSSITDGKTALFNQQSSNTIPALQNESKLTASVLSRQYLSGVSFDNQNYTTSSFIEASSPNLEYLPLQTANLKNSPPYIHSQLTTPSYKKMALNFDEFPPQSETTSFVSTTPTPFFDSVPPTSYKNPEKKPALQLDLTSGVSTEYFTTLPPDSESFDYPSIVPYQEQTTSQALPPLAGTEISLSDNDRILNQETTSVPSISDLYSEQATPVNNSPREQGLAGIDTTEFSNFDDYQDPLYQEPDSSLKISRQFFNEENEFATEQPYFNSKTVSNSETTSPEQLNTEKNSEYDTSVSDTLVMSKKKQQPFIMNKNPDVILNQPLPDSISSSVSNRRTTELPGLPPRQFLDISKTIPPEFYKNNNYATTPLESAYTTAPNSKEKQVPSEDNPIYNQFAQTSAVVNPNIDEEYSSPNQMSNKRPIENFGTTFFPKQVTSDSSQEQVLPSYTEQISESRSQKYPSERFPGSLPQTTSQPENFSLSSNQKPSNLQNFSTQKQYEESFDISASKYRNLDSLEQSEKLTTALPALVVDMIETQSDSPYTRNSFARKTKPFTAFEPFTEGPIQTTTSAVNPQISYSNEPLPPQTTTDIFDSQPSYSNESYIETPVPKFINPVLNPQSSYSDELYSKQPSSKVKSSTASSASFTFSENESRPYFIPDTNFASKRQPQGPKNQYNGLQFSQFRDRSTTFFRPPLTPWNKYQTVPTSELLPLNLEPQTVPLSSVNRSSDIPMPELRTFSEYDKEMTPIGIYREIPEPKPEESDFSSQIFSSSTNKFFPNFIQQSTESFNQHADGQESILNDTEPFSNISPKKSSSSTPVFTNPPSVQTPSHSFELQTQPQSSYSQVRSNSDNLESESLISTISNDRSRLVTLQPSFVTRPQPELNVLQPINRPTNFKFPDVPEQTPFDLSNTQDAKPDQYQTLESSTPSHTSQYQLEEIAPFIDSPVEVTLREKPQNTDSSIRNVVTSPANSEPQFKTNLAHSFDKLTIENSDQESASAYDIPLSRLPLDSPNNDNQYVSTIFPSQTNNNLDDTVTIPDHPSSAKHIFQPQLSAFDSKSDKASIDEQILVSPVEDQTQGEYFPTTLTLSSEIPNGNMTAQTEILDYPDTTIPGEAFTPIPWVTPFYSDAYKQSETANNSKSHYVQEKIPFHSTSLAPEPQHSSVYLPDISVKNTEPATPKRFYSTSPFELRPEELSPNGSPAANNLQTQRRNPYIETFAQNTPNTNSRSDIQLRNQDLNYFDELSNLKTSTLTYPTPDRQLPFVTDISSLEYITGDSVPDSQLTPNNTFLFLNQTPRFTPSDSLIFSDIKPKELLNKSNEPSQQNTAVPIRELSAKRKMNDFQTVISADNVLPQLEPRSAVKYDEEIIITQDQTSHSPKPQPQTSLKNMEKISESSIEEESVNLDANNSPYKQDLLAFAPTTPFEFQPTPTVSHSSLNFDNFGKDVNYKPLFLPPSLTETGNTVQQLDTMSTSSPDQIRENYDSNLYSQTPSSFPLKYQTQNMKSIEQKFTETTKPVPLTPQSEHEREFIKPDLEFSIQTDKPVSIYQPPYHSFSSKYQLSEKQISEANPALHGRFASTDSTQKPLKYLNNETPNTARVPSSEPHVLPSGLQTTSNQKDNSFAPYNKPLPMLPSDRQIPNTEVFTNAQSVPQTHAPQSLPNVYFNQFENYNSEIPSNEQLRNFNNNEFNRKNYPNTYQAFSNYQRAESRVPSESLFNSDQNPSNKRFATDSNVYSPTFYGPQSRLHTQYFPAYTHTNVRELSSDSVSSPTAYRQQTKTPSHTQPQLTEPNSGVDTKRLESNSKPPIRYEQPNDFFVPRNWDVTNFNSSSSESSDPYEQPRRSLSPFIRNDAMSLAPYPDTIPREPRPFGKSFLPFERKPEYVNSQSRFPSYSEAASYKPWSDSFGRFPDSYDRQTGPFINYGPSQTGPMFYPPYTETNYRPFQSHSLPNSLPDGQQTGSFRTLPQTQSQYIAPYSDARRKEFESDSYLSAEAEPASFPNQMPPFSFKKVESNSPESFYFNYEQQQQQPLPFNNSYSAQPPSFASNRDPSKTKTTKIVEEIITTTLPPNMTNSAEQLAFADKLLNNKKDSTEELRPPVVNDSPMRLFNNKNYENSRDEISGPPFTYNYKQLPNNHLTSVSQYIANNNAQQAERFSDRPFQIDEYESRSLNKKRPILENVTPPNNQILSTQSFNGKLLENNVRNPKTVMNVPTDRQVFDRQSTTITKEQDRSSYNYQAGPSNQPQIDSSPGFSKNVITYDNRARSTQEPQIFSPSSKTPTFSSPPVPTEQYSNPLFQTLETHLNLPLNEPSKLQEQPFPEQVSFGPKRASSFPLLNSSLLLETQNQNENFVNSYRSQPNDGVSTARDVTNTSQLDSHALVSDLTTPSKKPGEDYVSCCGPYSRGSIPTPLLCPFDRILKGNVTAPSYYILVSKLPVDDDEEERFQVEKVYLGDGMPLNCTLSTGKTFPTLLYTPIPFSAAGTVKLLTKSDSA